MLTFVIHLTEASVHIPTYISTSYIVKYIHTYSTHIHP